MNTVSQSDPSVIAANEQLGRRFFAEQDRLRGGPAPELCTDSYQAIIGGNPPMGRDGHEQFAVGFYAAFGDARHVIDDIFATEDRVAVRFIIQGAHTGNFFGVPSSGRRIETVANVFMTVEGGRVATLKAVFDLAGLMQQLTG